MSDLEVFLPDADATRAFGERIGRHARAGDVIAVEGTLGAGKTTLAQGVAVGLEVPPGHYVNSPSFAILLIHPGRVPFYHVDLYRLSDPDEALGLGLEEVLGTDGVALVEWPDRLPDVLPRDVLALRITNQGDGRRASLAARGPAAARLLGALR